MTLLLIIALLASFKRRWQRHWQRQKGSQSQRLTLSEAELPEFVRLSPVAMRYYRLLSSIRWGDFPERDLAMACPQIPIPYTPFAAACLVKLDQNLKYMSHLRRYLVEHPALVWLLGFPLSPSLVYPWRFDVDASLPTARHFTRMLRKIPNPCVQFLLEETVRLLQDELAETAPPFGQAISLDTKHIIAWVKENNPKAYVPDRYDKHKQPAGDPDCRLGCKRKHNQRTEDADDELPTPTTNPLPASTLAVGDYYWGYASGVVATKIPDWGEFVLAEFTQTLDRPDVSYFHPLMASTEQRLGFRPQFGAFDAAFDAFYVYAHFYRPGHEWAEGFAAVPFSQRNPRHKTFDENGHPYCEAGLVMTCQYTFITRTTLVEHERAHYVCPLKNQTETACPIQHPHRQKGGCTHRIPTSPGARLRHQIDRDSALYKEIYKQRTATERINSQAVELGIERPRLRNQQAIINQNTLIYVLINLRALQRVRQHKIEKTRTKLASA